MTTTDPSTANPSPEKGQSNRSNSRRARRQQAKGSTRVFAYRNALGLGPNIAVRVLDLSESGVRLIVKEALPVGQEFEVVFESIAGSRSVKMLANVVWTVPTENGEHCLGARFSKPLGYTHLSVLARS